MKRVLCSLALLFSSLSATNSLGNTLVVCGWTGPEGDYKFCQENLVQKLKGELGETNVVEAAWTRTEIGNILLRGEPDSDAIKRQILNAYLASKARNEPFTIIAHSRGAQLVYKALHDLQEPNELERLGFNPDFFNREPLRVDRLITLDPQQVLFESGKPPSVREWINFYKVAQSVPSSTAVSTPQRIEGGGGPPWPLTEGPMRGADRNLPVVGDHSFYADENFFNQELKPLLRQFPRARVAGPPTTPAAGSTLEVYDQIQKRRRQLTQIPQYLLTPSAATVWQRRIDPVTGQNLVQRYEEFYYAALDYHGLANQSLNYARDFLNRGDVEKARDYVKEADRYIKLSNLSEQAAIEVYRGNLEAAGTLADGIYKGSKKAVEFGAQFVPGASKIFDGLFLVTDFAIDASGDGRSQAAKNAVSKLLVEAIFEDVKVSALGNKALSEMLSKGTTQAIGSSGLYPILNDIVKSPELAKAVMTVLAKSAASEVVGFSEEQAKKILKGLQSSLLGMSGQFALRKKEETKQTKDCPEVQQTETAGSPTFEQWREWRDRVVGKSRMPGC